MVLKMNSILNKEILIKSPNKKLDFIHVNDVVDSYIAVMDNLSSLNNYNSFNVGTGIGTTIIQLSKIIGELLSKNNNVKYGNSEDDQVWCSNDKIKDTLSWSPKFNLNEGLKLTIDYYKWKYL